MPAHFLDRQCVISEHFSLPGFGNTYHGQDRHLPSLAIINHREVRPRGLGVHVALGKLARLPLFMLTL